MLLLPVRYILLSVWVRLSIFSQLSIIQYMGLCVFSLPISLVMIEAITLFLIIITKSEEGIIIHCFGLGHETMACAVCLSIFLLYYTVIHGKSIWHKFAKYMIGWRRPLDSVSCLEILWSTNDLTSHVVGGGSFPVDAKVQAIVLQPVSEADKCSLAWQTIEYTQKGIKVQMGWWKHQISCKWRCCWSKVIAKRKCPYIGLNTRAAAFWGICVL